MSVSERDLLLMHMRDVLSTKGGREVIHEILDMAGILTTTFTGNSQTYFLEGKRALGLDIIELMEEAEPTSYATMCLTKRSEEIK